MAYSKTHQKGKQAKGYLKIEHAYNLLLKNTPIPDIHKVFKEDYDLSVSQTSVYIRQAQADIKRLAEGRKEEMLERQLHRYDSLYAETREAELYKEALLALQQIDKLCGLTINKMDVTTGGDKITGITVEFVLPKKEDE